MVGPKNSWRDLTLDQMYRSIFQFVPISYSKLEVGVQMKQGYKDAKARMEANAAGQKTYYADVKDTFYRTAEEL